MTGFTSSSFFSIVFPGAFIGQKCQGQEMLTVLFLIFRHCVIVMVKGEVGINSESLAYTQTLLFRENSDCFLVRNYLPLLNVLMRSTKVAFKDPGICEMNDVLASAINNFL